MQTDGTDDGPGPHGGWVAPDRGAEADPSGGGSGPSGREPAGATDGSAWPSRAPQADGPKAGDARTGPLPLHPMSLSDLLDGAFKLLRADAGTIVLITLALFGPLQLVTAWAQRDTLDVFGLLLDPGSAPGAMEQGFGNPLIGMVAGLAQFLVLPFVTGAVARVVGGSYLGETIPVGTALKAALRRWWSLFSAWVLVHVVEFAGVLVGFALLVAGAVAGGGGAVAVVGVILVLLGFLGAVFVMPFFVAVAPAIVLEDLGAVRAMRRSAGLMRRRYWPYLGTAVLTGLLATIVSYALMAIPMGLAFAVGSGAWLLWALGSVIANVVALPFVAIVATLMYFDGRIRAEAFDLTVVADELARGRPA